MCLMPLETSNRVNLRMRHLQLDSMTLRHRLCAIDFGGVPLDRKLNCQPYDYPFKSKESLLNGLGIPNHRLYPSDIL